MNEFYGFCYDKGVTFYDNKISQVFKLCCENCGEDFIKVIVPPTAVVDWEIENGNHLYVSGNINEQGVMIADYVDRWGRYCSHCGKHHDAGFWIGEHDYACSEECAVALIGGQEAFDEAMNEYDDYANYNPICWVEWYN